MRRMVDDKEMITIDNRITALEQGGGGSGDAYTKAETDALLLAKLDVYKHFDDDDNPEEFYIKQPQTYSSGIELHASRDDNHHPDYANVLMTPTHIVMMANSANHGDDDDDYTGYIEITDDYVDLDVTDGTNTTTLRVTPSGATLNNVRIATMNDIPSTGKQLYAHSMIITCNDTTTGDSFGGLAYLISSDSTAITKDNIIAKLIAAGYDGSAKRIMFTGAAYLASNNGISATLNGLARFTNSDTDLRISYTYVDTNASAAINSSFRENITDANVSLTVQDTVITL